MTDRIAPAAGYRRIATEEAFIPPELHKMYRQLVASGGVNDPGFNSLVGYYFTHPSERARNVSERLQDLGVRRLADMDAAGIDMQIISLTSPGVQVLKPDVAVEMARLANDQLAEAIRRHPTRFAGLLAVAPQNPAEAAKEIERGATLGLSGVIINSHTLGEYLDFLVKRGVSPNVASFVGATTVRENVVGFDDVAPTPEQLKQMQDLVRQAMREGALGVGSSLIYAPASYAKTDELIAL